MAEEQVFPNAQVSYNTYVLFDCLICLRLDYYWWFCRMWCEKEVTGVIFSDFDSSPVPKFLNPGPAILQICKTDSCSDSGYNHRSNRNLPMFLLKKRPHRLLLLPKRKSGSGSGSGFSQIFDSGSERKTRNPVGVDSGTPDPVPPLVWRQLLLTLLFITAL